MKAKRGRFQPLPWRVSEATTGKDRKRTVGETKEEQKSDKNDGRDTSGKQARCSEIGTRQSARQRRQRERLRANNYSLCLAASMTMYHNNPS